MKKFDVAIIGAGMAGMLAAIELRKQGYKNLVLFEKADNVGGTWRENSYPGLTCDVPAHHAIERAKARKAEQGHDSEKEPAE